jgi:septum formation protein
VTSPCPIILASASPRRREILEQLGIGFEVRVSEIDETPVEGESPTAYVARLAEAKARAVAASLTPSARCLLIGADTTVVIEGEVLGKPGDVQESRRMLERLRGREHEVHTAIAVVDHPSGRLRLRTVTTRVQFRAFSDATLDRYAQSGEGLDKAGSYGIQGLGAGLVSAIQGSYSNVVGLPAAELVELLEAEGALEAWP